MAYVMLYGNGWTQRWAVRDEVLESVRAEIDRVGRPESGHLQVIDPGTGEPTTLVVAWQQIAAAIVLGGQDEQTADGSGSYR